jgi:hypothetical protein
MVEMLRDGAALVGLRVAQPGQNPSAPELIAAMKEDRCFTANQADVLDRLNRERHRLQHNSPGIPADEVIERVALMLKTMPRLLGSYIRWMDGHGIQVLPQ